MQKSQFSLKQLADLLDLTLHGQPNCEIHSVSTIQAAQSGQICFLANPQYKKYLATTKASAVILRESDLLSCPTNALVAKDPYLSYAKLSQLFALPIQRDSGCHSSATVGKNVCIQDSVSIGPHCVIGENTLIKTGVNIVANSVIGANCVIGHNVHIYPNVTILDGVVIGNGSIIHSGVVIGSDGFGFAKDKTTNRWEKICQLGGVIIGDDVEIGANTTIDRGAIGDTVIGNQVKLDNQIQIGHNVVIGDGTIIAGCVGIAGSTTIGSDCIIGGGAGIAGHLSIVDQVVITGMTMVTKSIPQPGIYSSGVAVSENQHWRKNAARFNQLDQLAKRLVDVEKQLKKIVQEE